MPDCHTTSDILSFVKKDEKGCLDYWSPETTGVWKTDNELGRACAEELIAQMRSEQAPILLGYVVSRIIEKGNYGGVEVGFFSRIGMSIIKGDS